MEFVYVVPREELFPECYPQGLVPFGEALARDDVEARVRRHGFFVERAYAERRPALQQIIPYSVVRSAADGRVLLVRRLAASGEARLHDKLSIGIGGHINPEDLQRPDDDPIAAGTRREISEELDLSEEYELTSVGLLNDDTNAVGAVHVGLVQVLTTPGSIAIRETENLEGRLVTPESLRDLAARGENFESWSAFLIEHIAQLLSADQFANAPALASPSP